MSARSWRALFTKTEWLLGITSQSEVLGQARPDLHFTPNAPLCPERILEHDGDCSAAIREKDIVINRRYESFEVVVDFPRQAAADPAVVSIKYTLYRAVDQSPLWPA